jgi:hypothetical protein
MEQLLDKQYPSTYLEAKEMPKWEKEMVVEYDPLIKNHTLDLVPVPPKKNLVGCKWAYSTKLTTNGQIENHKA